LVRITLILIISVCLTVLFESTKASSAIIFKQLSDSSIVYYSYNSGEIKLSLILDDQDTATLQKPDIVFIGEILDTKDFSQTMTDTLNDNRFKQTNYQSYTYTVRVDTVIVGIYSNDYLEITVKSSSSHEFSSRFSHISENGDSIYEGIGSLQPPCCGHLINKQIPVGEDCIFHFKTGELSVVDYISSYSCNDLQQYLTKSGLATE